MANFCCTYMNELDDVNRWWLPSEILSDIGIADAAERRRLAVVEDIAVRLAGVLGGASEIAQRRPPSSCHGLQVRDTGYSAMETLAGARHRRRGPSAAPPLYLPLPALAAAPWQVTGGLINNSHILHPAFAPQQRRLAPACHAFHRAGAHHPAATTTRRSGGTGVFLPRTDAAVVPRRVNVNVPARQCRAHQTPSHRPGVEAAAAMARRQQELQAMAAAMSQIQRRVDVPELALPQEWTY
ncbi:hypothetical protein GUJ93_ZPchr0003g16739 [Zizania palustris]|uniref:Uncharacterized protein n=1 Tax=Zizania palustris TaxID=103762 RepID=A0A8J5RUB7_ZIZPA|nr:hypothetical protein GUJ93_ZPchr0003g16739 [Zizania palustris]